MKYVYSVGNLSVSNGYRFTVVSHRRKMWLKNLNLTGTKLPKQPYVCSEHFKNSDFEMKQGGRVFLKKDACPFTITVEPEKVSLSSSTIEIDLEPDIDPELETQGPGPSRKKNSKEMDETLGVARLQLEKQMSLIDCGKRELEVYSCKKCIFSTHLFSCYKAHITNSRCRGGEYRNVTYQLFYTKEHSCRRCPFKTYSLLVFLRHEIVGCSLSKIRTRRRKCGLCPFTYTSDKKLKQHIKNVYKKLGCVLTQRNYRDWLTCKFCGFQTGNKSNFVEHIRNKHEHLITDEGLKSHLVFERSTHWLECEFCEFKCGEEDIMRLHEEENHEHMLYSVIRKENSVMFQCKLCKFSSEYLDCMGLHITDNHIKGYSKK